MSTFEVKITKISGIEPIEGADQIELVRIGDYRCVVRKDQFKVGENAIYIPEQALLPDWLLEEMNLAGKLAGSNKNRVKAIKLRGCLSQGLVLPLTEIAGKYTIQFKEMLLVIVDENTIAEMLGITKYEPAIPQSMAGEVCNIGSNNTLKYDIENIKRYNEVLKDGEEVYVTEKIHGTNICISHVPGLNNSELFEDGDIFVCSKGLGSQGLVFKNNENNKYNIYVQAFKELTKENKLTDMLKIYRNEHTSEWEPIYIFGELFGQGVQDLSYGLKDKQIRVFDVYLGRPGLGGYLNFEELKTFCEHLNLPVVDILYKGPYSKEKILELTSGNTITGASLHLREGVVIKPTTERIDNNLGRVILKSISDAYLLRKGGTELQ